MPRPKRQQPLLQQLGRTLLHSALIFDLGALPYDFMTANSVWQANCARLLDEISTESGRQRVLDLGVGPGVSALAMGRHHPGTVFVGLDLAQRMLERAVENRTDAGWHEERLTLVRGNALHLPLADASVDAVTGHSFLYLLPNQVAALTEAHRVLRRGGYIAFLEPRAGAVDWFWLVRQTSIRLFTSLTLWRVYSWLHDRFSAEYLCTRLSNAGFTDVTTEDTLGGFGIFGRARKP